MPVTRRSLQGRVTRPPWIVAEVRPVPQPVVGSEDLGAPPAFASCLQEAARGLANLLRMKPVAHTKRVGIVLLLAAALAAPLLLQGLPVAAANGRRSWGAAVLARARQAGFADVSDPQRPLSREHFIRWAVRADGLKPRKYNPAPGMAGIAGTRALRDGSLGAAASAGILDFSDYAGTDDFGGLQPMPRQEAVLVVVRMLGLGPAAVREAGPGTALNFADGAAVPGWARGFWAEAVRTHLVEGFPGRTLRPQATLTAAQGAALLLRVQAIWKREEVAGMQVSAAGRLAPALAARVNGRLFVAGDALYGGLPGAWTFDGGSGGQEFSFGAGNADWRFEGARLVCSVVSPRCTVWGPGSSQHTADLAAPPILVRGEVLLPLGSGGSLPFLNVQARPRRVDVSAAADWPTGELPTSPTGAVLVPAKLPPLAPGNRTYVTATFRDAAGAAILPARKLSATFSVPASSPLRLARDSAAAATATSLTVSSDVPSVLVAVSAAKDVAEGTFRLTESLPGYTPVHWSVPVRDQRPYAFAASIGPAPAAGRPVTATVTLLDRHGQTAGTDAPPDPVRLRIEGPTGRVTADPVYHYPSGTVILLFQHGVAQYRFTPPVAGAYTLTVSGRIPGAAPWTLAPATVEFTVS